MENEQQPVTVAGQSSTKPQHPVTAGQSSTKPQQPATAAQSPAGAHPVIKLNDFAVGFQNSQRTLWAVRGVNLTVNAGESVGIVGESGCGKSVMSQSVMRLLEHDQRIAYKGTVTCCGQDVLSKDLTDMTELRGAKVAQVFQDPLSSFDPLCGVGPQIAEAIMAHSDSSKSEARSAAVAAMESVGIENAEQRYKSRPDSFSGGQLQRLMIAMAIALKPCVLIADEPTTALDTTTQAEILQLLADCIANSNMAMVFISHDLNVVSNVCEYVNVMYRGSFVEQAAVADLFAHPYHPYTKGLLGAIPPLEGETPEKLTAIPGSVPPLEEEIVGCAFAPRCAQATERCRQEEPPCLNVSSTQDGERGSDQEPHVVACWLYERNGL